MFVLSLSLSLSLPLPSRLHCYSKAIKGRRFLFTQHGIPILYKRCGFLSLFFTVNPSGCPISHQTLARIRTRALGDLWGPITHVPPLYHDIDQCRIRIHILNRNKTNAYRNKRTGIRQRYVLKSEGFNMCENSIRVARIPSLVQSLYRVGLFKLIPSLLAHILSRVLGVIR